MRILLVRHGESCGNAQGRAQGLEDEPLTEWGHAQAEALAHRLQQEFDICAIYASPLKRALETARHASRLCQRPIIVHKDLREYDCGAITGMSMEEMRVSLPDLARSWASSVLWPTIPCEEGREVFLRRVMQAMSEITAVHQHEDTLAVVAHGGTCSAYLSGLLGLDYRQRQPWILNNASLSCVLLDGLRPHIALLNDTCHLGSLQRLQET